MKTQRIILLVSLILLAATVARGQPGVASDSVIYDFANTAGGGVSQGGSYRVSVTLGDPLVGSSQGGAYTMSSVFFSFLGGQQTAEDAPELLIALNGNRVVLSWPLPATGWVLDRTSALVDAATSWTEVSASYQTNKTHVLVTMPMSAEDTFFRLRKP